MTTLALSLVLVSSLAQAQVIYSWVGKDGVEHFTDDRSTAPRGAKVRTTQGEVISSLRMGSGEDRVPALDAGVQVVAQAPQSPQPDPSELTWRRQFRDARERVAVLEGEVEVLRQRVEEPGGMAISARYRCGSWGPFFPPQVLGGNAGSVGVTIGTWPTAGLSITGSASSTNGTFVTPFPSYPAPPCVLGFDPEYEHSRERLALSRQALERARADLVDLERRASFEGVPNEWRR